MQNNKNSLQSVMKAVMQDENLIKGYASKKCKQCLGRGYLEIKFAEKTYNLNLNADGIHEFPENFFS